MNKNITNAYIAAKDESIILEMLYEGKFKDLKDMSTLFTDAYLKNKNVIFWLEAECEKMNAKNQKGDENGKRV